MSCLFRAADNNERALEASGPDNGSVSVPVHVNGSDNEDADEDEDNQDIRGSDDDEQEDPKDYCKGGYHPITIGSVFNQRYHVIRKLGWGEWHARLVISNRWFVL